MPTCNAKVSCHIVQFITNVAHLVMSVGQLHRPAWCTPDVCRCKSTSFLHPVMIIPNSSRTHWGVIYQIWKQCRYFSTLWQIKSTGFFFKLVSLCWTFYISRALQSWTSLACNIMAAVSAHILFKQMHFLQAKTKLVPLSGQKETGLA